MRVRIRVRMIVRMRARMRVRYTPGIGVCGNTVLATRAPLAIPGSNPSTIGAVAANDLKAEQWGTCGWWYDWPTVLATATTKEGKAHAPKKVNQVSLNMVLPKTWVQVKLAFDF